MLPAAAPATRFASSSATERFGVAATTSEVDSKSSLSAGVGSTSLPHVVASREIGWPAGPGAVTLKVSDAVPFAGSDPIAQTSPPPNEAALQVPPVNESIGSDPLLLFLGLAYSFTPDAAALPLLFATVTV